ncbi:hypothetical protein C8R43DRAFT_1127314 [Mycena crocata]|nr:hypothetical protein C8R43DRAFT_1127314 [Mycena crocata]
MANPGHRRATVIDAEDVPSINEINWSLTLPFSDNAIVRQVTRSQTPLFLSCDDSDEEMEFFDSTASLPGTPQLKGLSEPPSTSASAAGLREGLSYRNDTFQPSFTHNPFQPSIIEQHGSLETGAIRVDHYDGIVIVIHLLITLLLQTLLRALVQLVNSTALVLALAALITRPRAVHCPLSHPCEPLFLTHLLTKKCGDNALLPPISGGNIPMLPVLTDQ